MRNLFSLIAQAALSVSVVVNGQPLQFDQPPVERAGRVFVPLRGVFEHLGASVVYQNGLINATGNGRNISLQIGSNQATVNGQAQTLDVAPFLIGSRTLVPLRFVAQALGAAVDWNNNTSTVVITGSGGSVSYTPEPNQSFNLSNRRPEGTINTQTPAIHANFSEPVRRNSLQVSIDGRDVTNDVYTNANGFDVTPSFALAVGSHRVQISGTTQANASFNTGWNFNVGTAGGGNFIRGIQPVAGTRVGANFNFSGRTRPGAQVQIVATGQTSAFGGILQIGTGTFQTTVQADGNGIFSTAIALNDVSGSQVRVIVQSTAPDGTSTEGSYLYTM
jgi:hypothetical protein